jgi:predicted hotdog family 3-hydroxylacyl-ACP dehydratase
MNAAAIPIGELLPHGPAMTLIDRIVSYAATRTVASAVVTERNPFFDGAGVPAWIGIEYMAQTVAAHAGLAARLRGDAPSIGFLLGTRAYASTVSTFPVGATLTIEVAPVAFEVGFATFDCSIAMARVVATAVVSTYVPSAAELATLHQRSSFA